MIQIRFHGRGGQGAKVASRIVGRAGFLAGLFAQDFPLFGAERQGAPIVASTRLSHEMIDRRGYVENPDLVVIMDDSLLKETHLKILQGVHRGIPVLVNSHGSQVDWLVEDLYPVVYIPLTLIAHRVIGHHSLSAVVAGAVAKFVPEITEDMLEAAISIELADIGLSPDLIRKNTLAAKMVYAGLPYFFLPEHPSEKAEAMQTPAKPPLLSFHETLSAATIRQPGNAFLRQTGGWRVERPRSVSGARWDFSGDNGHSSSMAARVETGSWRIFLARSLRNKEYERTIGL